MGKNFIVCCLVVVMVGTISKISVSAEICEQFDFGSSDTYYYIYSSGEAWDFTADSDMLVESIEIQSELSTTSSGTFHIRIEVNDTVVSVMDQYVDDEVFTQYIQSDDVTVNLQAGDKVTYRIYGFGSSTTSGCIRGPNYVKLCGTEGIRLSPPSLRDEFLTIISSFDSPESNPYGLASDGTYLWLMWQWGRTIYKIDTSGNVIDSFNFPYSIYAGDLAFDGTYLWVTGYYDDEIHKISTTGDLIDTIDSPENDPGGLTSDGTYLWVTSSNTTSNTVYKIDTSGNVLHTFDSPGNGFKGLAFDGNYLWHVDAVSKVLYKFDLEGNVMKTFQLPLSGSTMAPRGLTSDGISLWYSCYSDDKIYQLSFPQEVPAGTSKRQTFTFQVTGTQEVAIDMLSITNGDGSFCLENDTCSGETLSGPDSCTFDILFSPLTPGEYSANLLMPVNLSEQHTINAQLRWTAVEEVLSNPPNILPLIQFLLVE